MTRKELQRQNAEKRRYRDMYRKCLLAAAAIAGSCFVFMLAPMVNYSRDYGSILSGIFLSVVLWALVITAVMLVQKLYRFAALNGAGDREYRRAKPGLLCLAKNREALVAEIVFGIGVILWVLRAAGLFRADGFFRMSPYSLTFCGFLLHCFFNGKFYTYIKKQSHGKEVER